MKSSHFHTFQMLVTLCCALAFAVLLNPAQAESPRLREALVELRQIALDSASSKEDQITLLQEIGDLYLAQGRFELAEPYLERALKLATFSKPPNYARIMALTTQVSEIDLAYERYELATRKFNALLVQQRAKPRLTASWVKRMNLGLARARSGLAQTVLTRGSALASATVLMNQSIPELTEQLGPFHAESIAARLLNIEILLARGQLGEAQTEIQALEGGWSGRQPNATRLQRARLKFLNALLFARLNRMDEAMQSMAAALADVGGGHTQMSAEENAFWMEAATMGAILKARTGASGGAKAELQRVETIVSRIYGLGSLKHARWLIAVGALLGSVGDRSLGDSFTLRGKQIGQNDLSEMPKLAAQWAQDLGKEYTAESNELSLIKAHDQVRLLMAHLLKKPDNVAYWTERYPEFSMRVETQKAPPKIDFSSLTTMGSPAVSNNQTPISKAVSAPAAPASSPVKEAGASSQTPVVKPAKPVDKTSSVVRLGQKTKPITKLVAYAPPPASEQVGYYIAIGCYGSEQSSHKILAKVQARSLPVYQRTVRRTSSTLYCALAGPFESRPEADLAAESMTALGIKGFLIKTYR
ncbi:SPOR domain-containing protein [Magnetofaba australis]|uniref:SPOR domain-containing protein n=1 Tax=Magnetofaba australis IT-1 TaxID=1434232 RepID=A0A1Y2KAQ0_9PROT|nr:SPOR domain-containing protein [Magnetofaba australis]OSM08618.1 hypothetical protein MAIT1_02770 [Magnetofaba australis IT-1]